MSEYDIAIRDANKISSKANELREKRRQLNNLLNIVGTSYSGTDAEAYKNAVMKAQQELYDISISLDNIAADVRTEAEAIRNEE